MFDSQSKSSGEGEPCVDVLHYPPGKITPGKCVLTLSPYWKGQYRANSIAPAQERDLREIIWTKKKVSSDKLNFASESPRGPNIRSTSHHIDPGRTVMAGAEYGTDDMNG